MYELASAYRHRAARRRRQAQEEEGSRYPTATLDYEEERLVLGWAGLLLQWLGLRSTEVVYWQAECMAICSRENYGADADGNRGEMRTSIDEFEFSEWQKDGKPIDAKDVPAAILAAFDKLASEYEWHIG